MDQWVIGIISVEIIHDVFGKKEPYSLINES